MEVGKPQRIHRVEPIKEPVPSKAPPAEPERRVEPEKVPAK
ncbi:MAG TPA: hypothetical protein VLD16_06100 [Gaiellaceae bacterium]|nr:hypothetical protein [Gaiellaceae bacterium]